MRRAPESRRRLADGGLRPPLERDKDPENKRPSLMWRLFFRILVSLNRACAVGQPESTDGRRHPSWPSCSWWV